jgi:hypothetical protein
MNARTDMSDTIVEGNLVEESRKFLEPPRLTVNQRIHQGTHLFTDITFHYREDLIHRAEQLM